MLLFYPVNLAVGQWAVGLCCLAMPWVTITRLKADFRKCYNFPDNSLTIMDTLKCMRAPGL